MLGVLGILIIILCGVNTEIKTRIYSFHEIFPLVEYRHIWDASLLHFHVPPDTLNVTFTFEGITQSKFVTCKPLPVDVAIKYGAYPVISPENATWPETFANLTRPQVYKKHFLSNKTKQLIVVDVPYPGSWFGMAYRSFVPISERRIGLSDFNTACRCLLNAYLVVTSADVDHINIGESGQTVKVQRERLLKLDMARRSSQYVSIHFASDQTSFVYIRPFAIPSKKLYLHHFEIRKNKTQTIIINTDLYPINYVLINFEVDTERHVKIIATIHNNITSTSVSSSAPPETPSAASSPNSTLIVSTSNENETKIEFEPPRLMEMKLPSGKVLNYNQYDLIQMRADQDFSFSYIIQPNMDLKSPKLFNLTKPLTVLRLPIYGVDEIGGTLYSGFSLSPMRELKQKYIVIICVRLNAIEIPALPNHCTYKHDTHKAPMTLNSSEPIGTYENIHIPFPEIGIWYFSIGLFNLSKYQDLSNTDRITFNCAHLNESCKQFCRPTDRTCLSYCSEDVCEGTPEKLASNETQETKSGDGGKLMPDWLDQNVTDLKAGMVFSLAMSACLDEKCANGGACRIQSDNSLLFSYCYCHNDYQGWDCGDDSNVATNFMAFIDVFLLVGSNIGFAFSAFFGMRRTFYAEATVYLCVCFFSSIYHLCDAGKGVFTICVLPLSILKFCDFYCGLLSIWLTNIAIANLGPNIKSVCQILGSIFLVVGVSFNMESIFVFVAPLTCGMLIIAINWGINYKIDHLYPEKSYLLVNLPGGIFLVMFGVACFAFFETDNNYKFIHSLWHMLMAFSVILLLPTHSTFKNKGEDVRNVRMEETNALQENN